MRKWIVSTMFFCSVTLFAQNDLKGKYACCRNAYVFTFLENGRYELQENSFGTDDRNTGSKTSKGSYTVSNQQIALSKDADTTKSCCKKKQKKCCKKDSVTCDSTSAVEDKLELKRENGDLLWNRNGNWEKLYLQNAAE
ncbi:MAG: hypothetical protein IPM95_04390 [Sphingobacteriales bacterium]|nr:hypothetical protein [Sphingobacteriales bacterium]